MVSEALNVSVGIPLWAVKPLNYRLAVVIEQALAYNTHRTVSHVLR